MGTEDPPALSQISQLPGCAPEPPPARSQEDRCMIASPLLVLAPHTDDAELGCGGTIAKLLETTQDIYVAAFSTAEVSLPDGAKPTALRDEFTDAMRRLGVGEGNL